MGALPAACVPVLDRACCKTIRRSFGVVKKDYKTCRAPVIQSNACAVIQLNSSATAKVVANFMLAGRGASRRMNCAHRTKT